MIFLFMLSEKEGIFFAKPFSTLILFLSCWKMSGYKVLKRLKFPEKKFGTREIRGIVLHVCICNTIQKVA